MSDGAIHGLTTAFSHGRAFTESFFGKSPAAGSGYSLTVSGAYYERFVGVTFVLTTSSAVANRSVYLSYVNPGTGTVLTAGPTALQSASVANTYSGTVGFGASDWNAGTPAYFGLPDLILPAGYQVQINVANIDTADQLSAIAFVRERFQTGPDGFPVGYVPENELVENYVPLGL